MVERFDLVQYEHFDQLDRAFNGDWVRYSDHEAELSALKKQVEELTKALNRKVDEKCAAVQARTRAEAEAAALRKALKEIAEGRGVCEKCGTLASGEGAGYTDCGCTYPTWAPLNPSAHARSALTSTRETSE